MQIERIEVLVLKVPTGAKAFYSSQARFPERNSLLAKTTTDTGITGWGEGGQYGPPEPVASAIVDVLAPRLIGQQADLDFDGGDAGVGISRDFGRQRVHHCQRVAETLGVIAAGAVGRDRCPEPAAKQAVDRPVQRLTPNTPQRDVDGAHRLDIRAFLPEIPAEGIVLLPYSDRFIGLLPVEQDRARIELIQDTVGQGVKLMADANHANSSATALRMGRVLEKHDCLWFEEPVPPEDHDGYRRLRAALDVPIAGGECEFTRHGFRDLIGGGCVDIVQPDLCSSGGISEWTKIAGTASQHGVLAVPHVWGSGVAVAAALQAIATIPPAPHTAAPVPLQNEPMLEFDRSFNPLRDEILHENFSRVDGAVKIPTGPGLGISVDEAALEKFLVVRSSAGK